MKSNLSIRLLISLLLVGLAVLESSACGPFNPIIPTPEFFHKYGWGKSMADFDREENLRLWQSLTSDRIPLNDIYKVVYRDSWDAFDRATSVSKDNSNLFYRYINNTRDDEIKDFLQTAKSIEQSWASIQSPWYYPRSRDNNSEPNNFSEQIERSKQYDGSRLRDRYALQVTRALFASRQYAECIVYVDSAFADIANDNLMKRMAQRYVAGCWSRLDEVSRADSLFALAGDIWSLSVDKPAVYMIKHNPNAPQLVEYIRTHAKDSVLASDIYPLARRLVASNKAKCPGDWNFILAYIDNEYNGRTDAAHSEIHRAVNQKFSSDELRDLARAYKMKIDARIGDKSNLLSDLKWIENLMDPLNAESKEWIRRCQNVVYEDWVPALWRKKDYSTAILLCSYADNFSPKSQRYTACSPSRYGRPDVSLTRQQMRYSEDVFNLTDYGCLSFQLMGSLNSSQLASTYARIMSNTPLYSFLRRKANTDRDYYTELIGTLALREENYARAEKYLSQVSSHYLKTMNIYKSGELIGDPFKAYSSRDRKICNPDAKLKFAKKMKEYQHTMRNGRSSDDRGLARLMYAIGRYNSLNSNWALTEYWRGDPYMFKPDLQYWEDDFARENYGFLHGYKVYEPSYDDDEEEYVDPTEKIYEAEKKAALAMLRTDEAKAKAQYILFNLKTIIKHYGNTTTAQHIRTSCDHWKSWL